MSCPLRALYNYRSGRHNSGIPLGLHLRALGPTGVSASADTESMVEEGNGCVGEGVVVEKNEFFEVMDEAIRIVREEERGSKPEGWEDVEDCECFWVEGVGWSWRMVGE